MNQNKSASKKSKNDENKENSSNKPTGENKVKNQPGNKKSANKLQVQNTENKQKKDDATTTNRRLKDSNTILTESTKWSSFIGEQKQQSKADEKITVAVKKKEKAPKKKLELEASSSNTNNVNIDAVSKRAKTSCENENETNDGLLRLPINDTPRKSDPIVNFPNIGLSLPMTPLPVHFYKYDEDRNLFSFELIENVTLVVKNKALPPRKWKVIDVSVSSSSQFQDDESVIIDEHASSRPPQKSFDNSSICLEDIQLF